MYFNESQTLIVVSKDELYSNYLKKLVETNDDKGEDDVVGTPDGSIKIVSWTEKVWLDQKKAGNINNKILYLGNLKGNEKLLPIIDVKYDEHGIKYGWAGNQAILTADSKILGKDKYQEFFDLFCQLPVPENLKVNVMETTKENLKNKKILNEKPDKGNILKAVGGAALGLFAGPVGAISGAVAATVASNIYVGIQQQQFIFGLYKMYENDLNSFMND